MTNFIEQNNMPSYAKLYKYLSKLLSFIIYNYIFTDMNYQNNLIFPVCNNKMIFLINYV